MVCFPASLLMCPWHEDGLALEEESEGIAIAVSRSAVRSPASLLMCS